MCTLAPLSKSSGRWSNFEPAPRPWYEWPVPTCDPDADIWDKSQEDDDDASFKASLGGDTYESVNPLSPILEKAEAEAEEEEEEEEEGDEVEEEDEEEEEEQVEQEE